MWRLLSPQVESPLLILSSIPIHCKADATNLPKAAKLKKSYVDHATSTNLDYGILNWGSQNLVNFNAGKTQCCLGLSRHVDRNLTDISFDSNSLEFNDKILILRITGI